MASQQHTEEDLPPYAYCLPTGEQVLVEGPSSSFSVAIIRVVQETLLGTNVNDAWRLVQNVADLMRVQREGRQNSQPAQNVPMNTRAHPDEDTSLVFDTSEDSPMQDLHPF